jgi:uncharacterized protein (TIGR03083 family)
MAIAVTAGQWNATRAALRDSGERFTELVRGSDPRTRATREWSIADTAAHVTGIAQWEAALVRYGDGDDALPYPWNVLGGQIRTITVDTLAVLNEQILAGFTERDPLVLCEQLRTHIDDMLDASEGLDPDQPVPWLGGSSPPLAGVFAHLINELQIHGWDIARATGSRWVIPPAYAARFLDVFVTGLTRNGLGSLLAKDGPAPRRRIAVAFRSPYLTPLAFVLLPGGAVAVADPDSAVDVRVRLEPAAFNLMMFGRISRLRAALTGKVVVSGPRPWLLPAFLSIVRFPS